MGGIADSNHRNSDRTPSTRTTVTNPDLKAYAHRGFLGEVDCPQILPQKNLLISFIDYRGSDIIHFKKDTHSQTYEPEKVYESLILADN